MTDVATPKLTAEDLRHQLLMDGVRDYPGLGVTIESSFKKVREKAFEEAAGELADELERPEANIDQLWPLVFRWKRRAVAKEPQS